MDSLQNVVSKTTTAYTIEVIQMELKTPSASSRTWIVAEDIDDVRIYEKFVVRDKVGVHPSTDRPAGDKGWEHVESIVHEILSEYPNANIIGIRDCDYTRYERPAHIFPPHIFTTDERDLEMMMFASPSVQTSLNQWSDIICTKLQDAIVYTRYMGYLRICNHVCKLGCNFKKKVKLSKVWDDITHCFTDTWDDSLFQKFIGNCGNSCPSKSIINKEDFEAFIKELELNQEPWENICQGHDTIWTLSVLMIHNEKYSESEIMRHMTKSYAMEDFRKTELYNRITFWGSRRGLVVFN